MLDIGQTAEGEAREQDAISWWIDGPSEGRRPPSAFGNLFDADTASDSVEQLLGEDKLDASGSGIQALIAVLHVARLEAAPHDPVQEPSIQSGRENGRERGLEG